GFAGAAGWVLDEVVFEGLLMFVQRARLALPAEAAKAVQPALLELVEVALHGPGGAVGVLGDGGVGQAPALQPQPRQLALDARVGMVITVVANLRQGFLAETESTHGCLSPGDQRISNHAVAIRFSFGNSATLSRPEYKTGLA